MLAYLVAKGKPVELNQADHISATWLTPDSFDIVSCQCCSSINIQSLLSSSYRCPVVARQYCLSVSVKSVSCICCLDLLLLQLVLRLVQLLVFLQSMLRF